MKISIKSEIVLKRSQIKAKSIVWRPERKPNFICGIAIPLSQRNIKITRISWVVFFEIKIKSCLGLYWNSLLMFLWLFMFNEITHCVQWCHNLHTDPSAAFCTHTKSPPIHSCTYDQNHKSTSLTLLSHFYRAVADLCKRGACWVLSSLQHSTHISSDHAKTLFRNSHPSNTTHIRTRASVQYSMNTKIVQMHCRKKWNSNIFLRRNLYQRKKGKKSQKAKRFFKGQSTWNETKFLKFDLKRPIWQPCSPPEIPRSQFLSIISWIFTTLTTVLMR